VEDLEPDFVDVSKAMNFPRADAPPVYGVSGYTSKGTFLADPCCIAVNCGGSISDPSKITAALSFILQTAGHADVVGMASTQTGVELYLLDADLPGGLPPGWGPNFDPTTVPGSGWDYYNAVPPINPHAGLTLGIKDFPEASNARPEYFKVKTTFPIAPDQWHHLLLSFDLSNDCKTHAPVEPGAGRNETIAEGTDSYCKLWYAIDDKNYDGEDNLGPFFVSGGDDRNAILTDNAWSVAGAANFYIGNLAAPAPTCKYVSTPLPTSRTPAGIDTPLGIPANPQFVDSILRVEMAEFQMFTEVTLDTSVDSNRRAFIDYVRDDKGNVIRDKDGKATLKPVDPTKGTVADPITGTADDPRPLAEQLLGKKPELLLHTSKNWITGANTGTTDQFQPTALIRKYTPDPSIVG
jgi:hypothetical protein